MLYAAKAASVTVSDLYTLNAADASPTSVGATGYALTGLAFDPTDGTLYGVTSPGSGASPRYLVTIDVATGGAALVGPLGGTISDIAFNSTGDLYGWAPRNGTLPAGFGLCTIDKTSGATVLVAGSNINGNSGGLAFTAGNVLHVLLTVGGSTHLYAANPATGVLTLLGDTFVGGNPGAASFDAAGLLWWLKGGGGITTELHTVDVGTLADTTIGQPGGTDFDALAWSVTGGGGGGGGGQPEGISLAFDDPTLAPSPVWTRLDAGVTRVASYTIDRGRQFELDQTDGGRATIQINDVDGTLDPTNSAGPYYGKIEPLMQAAIARWNPVAHEWQTRFRGFVAEMDYVFNPDAWYVDNGDNVRGVNQLTLSLVDVFELLAQIPMMPGSFGDPPPAASAGQVFFDNANVDDRLRQIQGNAGLPDEFFVWFTGNVSLWETVYSPGETVLAAVQEAVDAEWPGVSNFYPDRFGRGVFHGRLARFDPAGVAATTTPDVWDFRHWKAGDGRATRASLSDTAQIRRFAFNRGTAKVYNQALAAPMHAEELLAALSEDLSDQVSNDATSQGLRGIRAWPPHQNLLTKTGLLDGSDALTETKRFGDFITLNFAEPRNRVTDLAFRPLPPGDSRAPALWDLLCGVDIADQVDITVGSPGGGGFNLEPFFVEGIHEEVVGRLRQGLQDGDEGYDDVTLSLDVSPTAYFTSNPFPTS